MGYYNIKKIKSFLKSLNIPKQFFNINLEEFFSNDYTMQISIRENAGKTTAGLLLGLALWVTHDHITTEYIRSDLAQIRRKSIINLYETVRQFGYFKKAFGENGWNDVTYQTMTRKFFLCKRDEEGNIIEKAIDPLCVVHANEEAESIKSSYNNPKGNFLFYDEFMDTSRMTLFQWEELMTNISTIGRTGTRVDLDGETPLAHLLMTGNNKSLYSPWFDDFCIQDQISQLKFGQYFKVKTDLGTTMIVQLLDQSEEFKERFKAGKIHFFGVRTKKAAQFTGITEWSGKTYPHIKESLRDLKPVFNQLYIKHRNRFIQLELYDKDFYFVFCHFSLEPKRDDAIILTLNPEDAREVYGFGSYEMREKIFQVIKIFVRLLKENRTYYASNFVGELLDDYSKNVQ